MSTQQTALTSYVDVDGVKIAYRRFGTPSSTSPPLVFLIHLRGTMDHWDPLLINPLALTREIILFDAPGVGKSSGEVLETTTEAAKSLAGLLAKLNITKCDVLGFSMGGFAAQMLAVNEGSLVRKLILAGTAPGGAGPGKSNLATSEGVLVGTVPATAGDTPATLEMWLEMLFVAGNEESLAEGRKFFARIHERNVEPHSDYVNGDGIARLWKQLLSFATTDGAERLASIKIPVFVANGNNDLVTPTVNSWIMSQQLSNAHLHIYPNSNHGFLFQYAPLFAKHVAEFLDA